MIDQYRQIQVETATPGELILMVYDIAISSLKKARLKLSEGNLEEANNSLLKAQNAIAELMCALNLDVDEIAKSLYSLYAYMLRRLNDSVIRKQAKPIDEVVNLLSSLKEAWEEIVKRETGGVAVQA